ncbi:hypothetical protein BE08_45355 [Sorangium cellulosum]|uniref:Uncharacterized protein n=1 Tax=Sorangium cellulosum TaxID=56 RepID=A0A150P005_SORCE|nr:hypothetical protein BE08_45355 [Sorangium cellulosum]
MARWQYDCGGIAMRVADAVWSDALSRSWFAMDAAGTAFRAKMHVLDPELYLQEILTVTPSYPLRRIFDLSPKNWSLIPFDGADEEADGGAAGAGGASTVRGRNWTTRALPEVSCDGAGATWAGGEAGRAGAAAVSGEVVTASWVSSVAAAAAAMCARCFFTAARVMPANRSATVRSSPHAAMAPSISARLACFPTGQQLTGASVAPLHIPVGIFVIRSVDYSR